MKKDWNDLTLEEKRWILGYPRKGLSATEGLLDLEVGEIENIGEVIEMEEDLGWWNNTTTTEEEWRASR